MSRLEELTTRLESFGSAPCIIGETSTRSYAELREAISGWRRQLSDRGVSPGEVCALRGDYSLDCIGLLLALLQLRAIAVLLPRNQDPRFFLEASLAQWFCDLGEDGSAAWTSHGSRQDHQLLGALRERGQGGIVVFTSGSSGKPKAALQSIERFLAKFAKRGRQLRTLAFLLFDHIAGQDTLFYTLSNGGTLVSTRRRDPDSVLQLMENKQVEVLPASPSFLRLLTLDGRVRERDLSSLKTITYGSEPMDATTLARLNELFPQVQIAQKYGTTETGSPRSVSRGNESLWMKLNNDAFETRVVDGVLCLRGEGTFLGYLNAPSPVDAEGWYNTGDRVDVDGEWIRFNGRVTDVINVGGEKVAPTEIEQVILELEFVRAAAVRGEPHPVLGQVVTTRIQIAAGTDPGHAINGVRTHCLERLPRHKVPVKISVDTLSLTTERQKVIRRDGAG